MPDDSRGSSALLRGPSAAQAAPYMQAVLARGEATRSAPPAPEAAPIPPPRAGRAVTERTAPGGPTRRDGGESQPYPGPERRSTIRRAADQPVTGSTLRLGDVYAGELARLRAHAHAEGYAAGFAEGSAAAAAVVARVEADERARMAEQHARWERRLVSAAAALGAAARQLEQAVTPVAEEVRDSVLDGVLTLVEDLLGRELAVAATPGVDALRRALTLCPADAPVVLRLHPDDLAELPAEAMAAFPDSLSVVADARVERAGAVAETGATRIDAQLGPALARVQAVLRT